MKKQISSIVLLAILILSTVSVFANPQQWDETTRNEYNEAKNQYNAARNDYRVAKQDWVQARSRYINERSQGNTDQAFQSAQRFMNSGTDVMLRHMEYLRIQVENNQYLNNQQAILDEIDADVDDINNEIIPQIERAQTRGELVDVSDRIRNKWDEIKVSVKRTTGTILDNKIQSSIEKTEDFVNRLETKATELEGQGYDITDVMTEINEINEHIALAKQAHEQAQVKFREIQNVAQADRLFGEGHTLIRNTEGYLKKAHAGLREAVMDLRGIVNDTTNNDGKTPNLEEA